MSSAYLPTNHGLREFGGNAANFEQDFGGRFLQQNEYNIFGLTSHEEPYALITRHESEKSIRSTIFKAPNSGARVLDQEQPPFDDSSFCSTSSLSPTPICRQFWKAGNYDERSNSKPARQNGSNFLRIHPKFLHSNATTHKWVFGAIAELLDNSVDEVRNGATFSIIDKTSNPRDGTPALLIQDDGGGMDPEAMRRCLSFGFSEKSQNAIGKYGNGFKASSMRIGADVVVFSRCKTNRTFTQSVGLLSYSFLIRTRKDKIVVPVLMLVSPKETLLNFGENVQGLSHALLILEYMVDYQFDTHSGTWNTLHNEQHVKNNLSILLQWSPVSTEAELLKQCDDIGHHGTKIIVYNLWHDDGGKVELDFDSNPEDICISGTNTEKVDPLSEAIDQHLANRMHYSLRAYLSILYLRVPENFHILLRGRAVEFHNIARDLKFPQFIVYRPHKTGSVLTTIGFLKEARAVNIHGFNVYHKNRLILPFWHVVAYTKNRGRGVVGVLEANFIEPTHNKQDFEKTQVFQKLEARLKAMTLEYWDHHCGLLGYYQYRKARSISIPHAASDSRVGHGIYEPVMLDKVSVAFGAKSSSAAGGSQNEVSGSLDLVAPISEWSLSSIHQNTREGALKRKGKWHDDNGELESVKRRGVVGPITITLDSDCDGDDQLVVDPAKELEDEKIAKLVQEHQKLLAQCQEYGKINEELDLKITRLTKEVREEQRECDRMLLELRLLEGLAEEYREIRAV